MCKIIDGVEHLDDTPVVKRTRLRMPQSSVLRMRQAIRQELSMQAEQAGNETFEEADDFDLPDSENWVSPYEDLFDPVLPSVTTDSAEGKTAASSAAESDSSAKPVSGNEPA